MPVHVNSRLRRRGRLLLCLGALLAVLAVSGGVGAGTAAAGCGGLHCLPGSGYTFDDNWDCGVIENNVRCMSALHTYGWGSAAYNGAGTTWVCIYLEGHASSCGNNLARACYFVSCNDQSEHNYRSYVTNTGTPHTVIGHGKA